MGTYRSGLPQCDGGLYLTDGGLETTLVFLEGWDLPHFAAFDLLKSEQGRAALKSYFERYMAIARAAGLPFVLESPTWRASADWGAKLGYSEVALAAANRASIDLMKELRDAAGGTAPIVISGNIGPRGDGYVPGELMTADEAEAYHAPQVRTFAATDADMVAAFTMTNVPEATGIARAAKKAAVPVAISFTLETDGRLPTGESLEHAVTAVDAATGGSPAYYMINCAHPTHFEGTLAAGGAWLERLRGLRANASRRSHAELNESPDLDAGDPDEFGAGHRDLLRRHRHLSVFGGCCGTDHRHVACVCTACAPEAAKQRPAA